MSFLTFFISTQYNNEWKEHNLFKKLFKVNALDVNKIVNSKRETYGTKKTHLNTLLGIMIMMTLDHCE